MGLFSRSRFAALKKSLQKLPGFAEDKPHSLGFLNGAQFLGAMNDNMFKLILVFMAIDVIGKNKASIILSAAGATFVLPFLLFSSMAGVLADRFSKQKLLVVMKVAECTTMFLALFAFASRSIWAGYTLLFLLATHSALFGPAKYGIIPEIVPKERVSRANGLITGFTYLAMIFGFFFASFLTEITHRRFVLATSFCLLMAIIGLVCSLGIKKTAPQGSKKRINPLFVREIFHTLAFTRGIKHLLISVCGSAYFLFVGGFTQLNIIPYAIESLNLSDVAGGYLFLSTAFGIAIGSFLAGKASKKHIELGLSCFAGIALGITFLLLALFHKNLIAVVIMLVLLGVFGGAFIVPFDSYTQLISPQERRGQIIGAANFLSFCGVLLASLALFVFSDFLDISAASGFGVMGICTLFVSLLFIGRLSDLALPYLARKFTLLKQIKTSGLELLDKSPNAALILAEPNLKKTRMLLAVVPNLQLFIAPKPGKNRRWLNRFFYSVHILPEAKDAETLFSTSSTLKKENLRPCFLIDQPPQTEKNRFSFRDLFSSPSLILVDVRTEPGRSTTITFSKS